MIDYTVSISDDVKTLYVTGKTQTMNGKKYETLTKEKIRAKFYTNQKTAQNKAYKLNNSDLYEDGSFVVKKVETEVICR